MDMRTGLICTSCPGISSRWIPIVINSLCPISYVCVGSRSVLNLTYSLNPNSPVFFEYVFTQRGRLQLLRSLGDLKYKQVPGVPPEGQVHILPFLCAPPPITLLSIRR